MGKNTWYIVRGSNARIVFKTRGHEVLELGLADKRLTRTTRIAKRTIASWELQPKPKKKKPRSAARRPLWLRDPLLLSAGLFREITRRIAANRRRR